MISRGRYFKKFYAAVFLLVLSSIIVMLYKEAFSLLGEIFLITLALLFAGIAVYTVFNNYRNSPKVEVNDDSITFNRTKKYYWKDIEKIEMTGKWPFDFWGNKKEGVLLKFKGERERYIFDDMYFNVPTVKTHIQNIAVQKGFLEPTPERSIHFANAADGNFKFYDGRQLCSFSGIVLWGMILMLVLAGLVDLFEKQHIVLIIFAPIFSLMALILLSMQMKYFAVSEKLFLIKTHNFFWLKTIYKLSDIREVVFELAKGRMVNYTLRIIFNDFTTATYPAATLWSKTWLQLKADLESKGIKVRNECVTYEPFEFKLFND
ncbi:MAG TPA: hypothetical protein VJ844_13505 [Mucilaginibacter sp.]|nr:hypothetical protein [Mucilaginibacter sp.]